MVSVKLPAAPQGPTVRVGGKQAAVTAVADTPVFDVTPARCTIQPGSHVFTTVTFSPLALQANTIRHTQPQSLSLSLVSVIIQPGSHVFTTVTFSPLALQANTIRHTQPQSLSLSLSVVSVIIQPGSHVFMTVGSKPVNQG